MTSTAVPKYGHHDGQGHDHILTSGEHSNAPAGRVARRMQRRARGPRGGHPPGMTRMTACRRRPRARAGARASNTGLGGTEGTRQRCRAGRQRAR